ncbi:FecR family protein [Chitinophaga nivalis]|uniref:DUF4974 domain-containing protein n=1 Tax=Chitinophaga nivalis TaxID=2991709 RepID=A0ABT3IEN9_9BACT|nr:FecR domain-containing protein [Chitinophaga nivalis]MCW3467893.1 DUF4974 domain-containing protein [Chitinophaga nivalis]MCW3482416.1 DUF4974 domain-containing protein [Chitinophaga nivalis]
MARKVANEATVAELEELELLLARFPEWQYAFTIVEEVTDVRVAKGFSGAEEQQLLQEGWDRISDFIAQPEKAVIKKMAPWKMMTGIAACIAILVTAYSLWQMPGKTTYRNEVITKNGSKTSLILPDGTSVVLNACSRLQYDANRFLSGKREVVLTGEAYFDVKQDPSHPFMIKAGQVNIRVLGTVFNVKAYTEDATVETTLLSGKVEVHFPENTTARQRVVVLQPEQKLTIGNRLPAQQQPTITNNNKTDQSYAITPVKINAAGQTDAVNLETAWMSDRFEFDKITLEQLSHDLERWYNVTVKFRNDRYKKEVVTGAFRKQHLEEILQALQLMTGFHYEVNNSENVIYIW